MNIKLAFVLIIILSSCATLFNSDNQKVTIKTSKPAAIKFRGFDLSANYDSTKFTFKVPRSDVPVNVDLKTDSVKRTITLNSKIDPIIFLNIFNYGIGYIIDLGTLKKYKYPKLNYIDFEEDPNGEYFPFMPLSRDYLNKKNRIKFTPFKLFQRNGPAIQLGYERIIDDKLSLQINASLIGNFLLDNRTTHNGAGVSIEGKYYFQNPRHYIQPYVSLEAGYLQDFYNESGWFHNIQSRDTINEIDFNVFHQEVYLVPKIGVQYILSEKVTLETFLGLGVRQRSIKQHGVPEDYELIRNYRDWAISGIGNSGNRFPGTFTEAKFLFNFRLGVVF